MSKDKNMNNTFKSPSTSSAFKSPSTSSAFKSPSTSSAFADNSSTALITENVLTFRRISYQHTPPTIVPRREQSFIIMNDHDPMTRSILMDNAVRQGAFLPFDYRIANTFASIRQQRSHPKESVKFPVIPSPIFKSPSTNSDAFGNLTNSMTKLAKQRLILRNISIKKKHNLKPVVDKLGKGSLTMSDADFSTDIPNAMELVSQNRTRKSSMEQNLLDAMKRERLQQARYRLLPINRAPFA